MAGSGQTSIKFNDAFFDQILNSAGVRALTRGAAEKALGVAKANAPVDTGAYRDGLQVEAVQRAHRTTFMVVGTDAKTMLVESKTGNLRKALKAVKRFYADNSTGCWCGSGDVNAIVRRMRNESKPSEAQIARECEARGLSADEAWMYRRQRMLGNGPEQAQQQALTMRNPLELPAAQPKSRSTARRFAGAQKLGAASLGSILRGA